jgi:hypothetical protein
MDGPVRAGVHDAPAARGLLLIGRKLAGQRESTGEPSTADLELLFFGGPTPPVHLGKRWTLDPRGARPGKEHRPAPARRKRRSEARRRWRRRWWSFALKNAFSNVALIGQDVPVGVANVVVPHHRIRPRVSGLHRRITWTPTTRASWGFERTSGPCIAGLSLSNSSGQPHPGYRNANRHQRHSGAPLQRVSGYHVLLPFDRHIPGGCVCKRGER